MTSAYCSNCKRKTAHQQPFGIGTLIAFLITLGLWIFVMPFYANRCVSCGKTNLWKNEEDNSTRNSALRALFTNLVPCPDCGKQMSPHALSCPNCGRQADVLCAECGQGNLAGLDYCEGCGVMLRQRSMEKNIKRGERGNPIKLEKWS